jgi:hypothetical protein
MNLLATETRQVWYLGNDIYRVEVTATAEEWRAAEALQRSRARAQVDNDGRALTRAIRDVKTSGVAWARAESDRLDAETDRENAFRWEEEARVLSACALMVRWGLPPDRPAVPDRPDRRLIGRLGFRGWKVLDDKWRAADAAARDWDRAWKDAIG